MDINQVNAQLSDLPSTFTRPGTPYTQWQDSWAEALALFTNGCDGVIAQTDFDGSTYASGSGAQFGWLDVWGEIFGIVRNSNESDVLYAARISATLLAWVGTIPAIQACGMQILSTIVSVIENITSLGYSIVIPYSPTTAQLQFFVSALARVRPAGVPVTLGTTTGGIYLTTISYLGENPSVAGAYLTAGVTYVSGLFGSNTNNSVPLLPDLLLTDQTINPTLS